MLMSAVEILEFKHDDFEKIYIFHNLKTKVSGVIVIHHSGSGPALGGCRIHAYPTFLSGLQDCLQLARSMTYKNIMMSMPYGGGKAVLFHRADIPRHAYFDTLAEVLNQLGGLYYTTDDVGCSVHDMNYLRQFSPYVKGELYNQAQIPATSYGVFQAIKAVLHFKEKITSFEGIEIIVQGLGKVGYPLCKFLHAEGFKIYVDDIDASLVSRAVKDFGATYMDISQAAEIKAKIFSPCALGGIINKDLVSRLNVKYIIGGANNQLARPEMADILHQNNIIWMPDYLCNAGGVIDIICEGSDYSTDYVYEKITAIYNRSLDILQKSDELKKPPFAVSDQYIHEALEKLSASRVLDLKTRRNLCLLESETMIRNISDVI